MTDKVKFLCEIIDKSFRELAKEIESKHISAFIIDGAVYIADIEDIDNKKLEYYRGGKQ